MGIITEISYQKRNKSRVNVYVDGEFYGGMSALVVAENRLRTGTVTDEERMRELMYLSEMELASDAAIKLVSRALKTERELRRYLEGKEYSPRVVDEVVNKLISYSYINDHEYAAAYAATYSSVHGKKKLSFDLRGKGVKADIIDKVLSQYYDERDTAMGLAVKYVKGKTLDRKTRKNLSNFLYSKGFEWDLYDGVISEIFESNGGCQDGECDD